MSSKGTSTVKTSKKKVEQEVTLTTLHGQVQEMDKRMNLRVWTVEQSMNELKMEFQEARIESNKRFDAVMVNLDKIMHKLESFETERYATIARFERIEKVVFNE